MKDAHIASIGSINAYLSYLRNHLSEIRWVPSLCDSPRVTDTGGGISRSLRQCDHFAAVAGTEGGVEFVVDRFAKEMDAAMAHAD